LISLGFKVTRTFARMQREFSIDGDILTKLACQRPGAGVLYASCFGFQ
jgi:hypothetical protein